MSARKVAYRSLVRVTSSEHFATPTLQEEIASAGLDGRDAALATQLVMGVLRHRRRLWRALTSATNNQRLKVSRRLRVILEVAAYELLELDSIPPRASIHEAVRSACA